MKTAKPWVKITMLDPTTLSPEKQNIIEDLFVNLRPYVKSNVKMNGDPVSVTQCSSVVALDFIQNGLCTLEIDGTKYELKLGGVLNIQTPNNEIEKNDRDGLTYYHFLYKISELLKKKQSIKLSEIYTAVSNELTEKTKISDDMIKEILKALPKIKAICSKPRMGLTTIEILQDTAKTKRTNHHTIKHLASNSEQWKAVLLGEIIPKKLLSEIGEDYISIYENRFFKKAIDDLTRFVRKEYAKFNSNITKAGDIEKKVKECLNAFLRMKSSSFYKSISDRAPLKNIYPTNILNFDQRYHALYDLWNKVTRKNKETKEKTEKNGDEKFDSKKISSYYYYFFKLVLLSAFYEIQSGEKGFSWLGEPRSDRDYASLFNVEFKTKEEDEIIKIEFSEIKKISGYVSVSIEEKEANNASYISIKYNINYYRLPASNDFNRLYELNNKYNDDYNYNQDDHILSKKKEKVLSNVPTDLFKLRSRQNSKEWESICRAINDSTHKRTRTLILRAFPVRFNYGERKQKIIKELLKDDKEKITADAFAYIFPNNPIGIKQEEYNDKKPDEIRNDFNFFMGFGNSFSNSDLNDFNLSILPVYRAFSFEWGEIKNSFHEYNIKSIKKFLYIQYAYFILENKAQICPVCGALKKEFLGKCDNCQRSFTQINCANKGCRKDFYYLPPENIDENIENECDFNTENKTLRDIWNERFGYTSLRSHKFGLSNRSDREESCYHCGSPDKN